MKNLIQQLEPRRLFVAIAPDTIQGVDLTIFARDQSVFPVGSDYLFHAETVSDYRLEEIGGPGRTSGTYSYIKKSDTTGVVQFNDPVAGSNAFRLTFTTPNSGAYKLIDASSRSEQGAFLVGAPADGYAPPTIPGVHFFSTVIDGAGVFADVGAYQFSPADDGSFSNTALTSNIQSSTGSYAYSKTGEATGVLTLSDSVAGGGLTETLTFLTPTTGTYEIAGGGGAFQRGVFEVVGELPPPPAPRLEIALENPPASVVIGIKATQKIRLTNTGTLDYNAVTPVELIASTDSTIDDSDQSLALFPKPLRLKPAASKVVTLKFNYPTTVGDYQLIARAGIEGDTLSAPSPFHAGEPYIDLTPTVSILRGKPGVSVENIGNAPSVGLATIELFTSSDSTLDESDSLIANVTQSLRIKSGHAKTVKFKAVAQSGTYIFAKITWLGAPADKYLENNVGVVQVV